MEKASLTVPSISCDKCSASIKDKVGSLKGVKNVSVNLKSQTVEVEFDPQEVNITDIAGKISSMGYEVLS